MEALIIAAGEGIRFGELTEKMPKPLLEISEKPLIGWVLKSLKKAMVKDVFITVGYKGEMIKQEIGDSYDNMDITYIDNPKWKKGNLQSLLVAEPYLKNDFILCMSDHLFDPIIVSKLVEYKTNKTVLLAVDRDFHQKSDDTKALVDEDGLIKNIGKNIIGNYVDTGLFKCKPRIFEYAKTVADNGRFELGDCMNLAAESREVKALDIGHRFWIDVDTPEELKNYYVINYKKYFERGEW